MRVRRWGFGSRHQTHSRLLHYPARRVYTFVRGTLLERWSTLLSMAWTTGVAVPWNTFYKSAKPHSTGHLDCFRNTARVLTVVTPCDTSVSPLKHILRVIQSVLRIFLRSSLKPCWLVIYCEKLPSFRNTLKGIQGYHSCSPRETTAPQEYSWEYSGLRYLWTLVILEHCSTTSIARYYIVSQFLLLH